MKLSAYLKEKGLTVEQFGQQIGRSGASVSRIANDKQRPDWDTIAAIERATEGQVTVADFMPTSPFRPAAAGADRPAAQSDGDDAADLRATGT